MPETYTLRHKAVAEFLGTFSIVFFGAGAVAIDLLTAPAGAGADTLFVNDGLGLGTLGWVGIALAFFGAVAVPIALLGRVSGQHINPAVTIALLVTGRIDLRSSVVYIIAQLAGGIGAGIVFVGIRGEDAVDIGVMGATAPFPGVSALQAVLAEGVITFFLMLTIMAFAVDDRTPDNAAGPAIGLIVAVGILTTGNVSGASLNPARTIGPYATNTLFGGPNLWEDVWVYVLGPTVGAVAGAAAYTWLVLDPIKPATPATGESAAEEAEPR